MRTWPSLQEYNQALAPQFVNSKLKLPGLMVQSIQTNLYGLPNALSGGFAYIYQLTLTDGSHRALRLFHSIREDRMTQLKNAYTLVSTIRENDKTLKDFFVEALWVDACLDVPSGPVPGILMDWVEAPVLAFWLEKNYHKPEKIQLLRRRIQKLQRALEAGGFLHGDLQANNITVDDEGQIFLLDYDNVNRREDYNPEWESGHIHFQHPDPVHHAMAADRFPFLVMDLGLAILGQEPDLFNQYGQGENVLFTADDFTQPRSSPLLRHAAALPGMGTLCTLFTAICEGSSSAVPSISEFHETAALGSGYTEILTMKQEVILPEPALAVSGFLGITGTKQKSRPYRPIYPIYSPDRFFSYSNHLVGEKIELVGHIYSIKKGYTKYGDPYIFVNFNDWRQGGIKLIFWSEGLDAFDDQGPDQSWEGRWISATGMVDEPYEKRRYESTSYSITITDPSQIRLISDTEAKRRLKAQASSSNPEAEETSFGYKTASAFTGPDPLEGLPSNDELLHQLSAKETPRTPPYRGFPQPSIPPASNKTDVSKHFGCLSVYIIAFIIIMLLVFAW